MITENNYENRLIEFYLLTNDARSLNRLANLVPI